MKHLRPLRDPDIAEIMDENEAASLMYHELGDDEEEIAFWSERFWMSPETLTKLVRRGIGVDSEMKKPHDEHNAGRQARLAAVACTPLCTPGMGVNLWGESPLYVNPVNVKALTKVLAEGKGGTVRDRLEEARVQSCEPTNRNGIQGPVSG